MGILQHQRCQSNVEQKGELILIAALIMAAIAALCGCGGWAFMIWLFKDKEVELSKRRKTILIAVSAVLFLAMALLLYAGMSDDASTTYSFFEAVRALIVICGLFFAGYIDYKLMIIPNKLLGVMLAAGLVSYGVEFILYPDMVYYEIPTALLGCAVCFVIFLVGKLIAKKGMGMGDIKAVAVVGVMLGIESALGCMLWSMIFAAVASLVLLIAKKANTKSKIAMAPFFFFGTVTAYSILALGGIFK